MRLKRYGKNDARRYTENTKPKASNWHVVKTYQKQRHYKIVYKVNYFIMSGFSLVIGFFLFQR